MILLSLNKYLLALENILRIYFSLVEGYLLSVDVFMHLLFVHFIIVNKKVVMLLHDYFESPVSATRGRYIGDSGKATYCKLSWELSWNLVSYFFTYN